MAWFTHMGNVNSAQRRKRPDKDGGKGMFLGSPPSSSLLCIGRSLAPLPPPNSTNPSICQCNHCFCHRRGPWCWRYPQDLRLISSPSSFPLCSPLVACSVRGSALRSRSVGDCLHVGAVFEGARGALVSLVGKCKRVTSGEIPYGKSTLRW